MGTNSSANEDQLDKLRRSFHENGLIVMTLIGGFSLASIILILGDNGSFTPASLNTPSWLAGYTNAQLYFAEILVFLGGYSVLAILLSFIMLLMASTRKKATEFRFLHLFVQGGIGLMVATFGVFLGILINPFSPLAANLVTIIYFLVLFVMAIFGSLDQFFSERRQKAQRKEIEEYEGWPY